MTQTTILDSRFFIVHEKRSVLRSLNCLDNNREDCY